MILGHHVPPYDHCHNQVKTPMKHFMGAQGVSDGGLGQSCVELQVVYSRAGMKLIRGFCLLVTAIYQSVS